jgi:cleavage stimulation factor subunit 2
MLNLVHTRSISCNENHKTNHADVSFVFLLSCLDHETAASAVRNLNNTDVGGRPLRIDLADSDPFLEGKTTVRGELLDGGFPGPSEPRSQWRPPGGRAPETEAFLTNLPPGIQVPKGSSVLDSISQLLASMAPNQLMEVLAQMKVLGLLVVVIQLR